MGPTIHATAVLVGRRAALIRGSSGSGKSAVALALLAMATRGDIPFARLVGDDRVHVHAVNGRLVVRAAYTLAGLIERRGAGIEQVAYEPVAVVGLVVDLSAEDGGRMPEEGALSAEIAGVRLRRLPMPVGTGATDAAALVARVLRGAG